MNALTDMLNMPAMTSIRAEEIISTIEARRQMMFEKYQSQYPEAYISDLFLMDIAKDEKDEMACRNCKGYPCLKKRNQGYQHVLKVIFGELRISYKICEQKKAADIQRKVSRRFSLAKIPAMYIGKTFADYESDAGNKNAIAWAKAADSLYLYGSPGTGKTFLASIVAQEKLKQGKTVIFGDVPSLLDQLKETFNADSENTTQELMESLSAVDVLVLDDLGTETPTEWAVERLYLIVNARYTANKAIIVTSNYPLDVVADRLNKPKKGEIGVTGSRIVSRLRQMCKIASITGNDRRTIRR